MRMRGLILDLHTKFFLRTLLRAIGECAGWIRFFSREPTSMEIRYCVPQKSVGLRHRYLLMRTSENSKNSIKRFGFPTITLSVLRTKRIIGRGRRCSGRNFLRQGISIRGHTRDFTASGVKRSLRKKNLLTESAPTTEQCRKL